MERFQIKKQLWQSPLQNSMVIDRIRMSYVASTIKLYHLAGPKSCDFLDTWMIPSLLAFQKQLNYGIPSEIRARRLERSKIYVFIL